MVVMPHPARMIALALVAAVIMLATAACSELLESTGQVQVNDIPQPTSTAAPTRSTLSHAEQLAAAQRAQETADRALLDEFLVQVSRQLSPEAALEFSADAEPAVFREAGESVCLKSALYIDLGIEEWAAWNSEQARTLNVLSPGLSVEEWGTVNGIQLRVYCPDVANQIALAAARQQANN